MNNSPIIFILDAGGTGFKFSAVRNGQEIIEPFTIPSAAPTLEEVLMKLINGFHECEKRCDAKATAISFCFPGPADYPNGIIGDLENLPSFKGGVALKAMLENEFQVPVYINNDGDLFAYGEALAGLLPHIVIARIVGRTCVMSQPDSVLLSICPNGFKEILTTVIAGIIPRSLYLPGECTVAVIDIIDIHSIIFKMKKILPVIGNWKIQLLTVKNLKKVLHTLLNLFLIFFFSMPVYTNLQPGRLCILNISFIASICIMLPVIKSTKSHNYKFTACSLDLLKIYIIQACLSVFYGYYSVFIHNLITCLNQAIKMISDQYLPLLIYKIRFL